ncbi:MAG: threonine dehydratase [Mariniblastus sp.]|jgi:threonine dehydratase
MKLQRKIPMDTTRTVVFGDVQDAAQRIASHAHRTPVVTCRTIDDLVGACVFFKCENFQKSGAFKFRGAVNAISNLSAEELSRGVVTHSSGNHAGALALAAKVFGTRAYIVMPSNSSAVKQAAVRTYGGLITECEPTLESRLNVAERLQEETGAVMIPPFNHPHVIAGQATAALELLDQVNDLEMIVAPVGGGGLMSGTCVAVRSLQPEVTVWGAEPTGADDAFASKQAGQLIPQLSPDTVADGLRTSLGDLTWPYIRDEVDEIVTVTDQETITAMKMFWERTKMIIEPSSAVPLAALIKRFGESVSDSIRRPSKIGIILSGGNVDLANLPW